MPYLDSRSFHSTDEANFMAKLLVRIKQLARYGVRKRFLVWRTIAPEVREEYLIEGEKLAQGTR